MRRYGATSMAEAVRRAVARELLLERELAKVRTLQIQGRNEKGEDLKILLS